MINFTVQVTDSQTNLVTIIPLSLTVDQATPLTITTGISLPTVVQGRSYSTMLTSLGGQPPYTWTADGLPEGLTCASNGTISGTTNAFGIFSLHCTRDRQRHQRPHAP